MGCNKTFAREAIKAAFKRLDRRGDRYEGRLAKEAIVQDGFVEWCARGRITPDFCMVHVPLPLRARAGGTERHNSPCRLCGSQACRAP